ncbi:endonuclease III [Pseudomonas brassicacearum]|uniref:Endonuclease III n=1 Tax=Pseudomonas brassicacearum TaxID=930166 RepID=A0AAW8M8U2_9PSED|nr:DNA methylase [Pseudomonas brassicacearum]MDR6957788.1 endonuclease III [Pseudomonas brassicacearum]
MIPVNATDLGIDVADQRRHGLYKWLLASFLLGKRIRSSVALQAYRILVDHHGLDTPGRLSQCAHRELVRLLGQAGYARYDESTARRLSVLAARIDKEMPMRLEAIRRGTDGIQDVERWLLTFEGIGPKTLEIFMREARAVLGSIAPR